jgi:hypothetical protein
MKKITLLVLCGLFAQQLSAQFEPDTRFLFKKVWPIMQHDSIVYSDDSGSAFVAEETVSIYLFQNDHIDSMNLHYQGNIEAIWNGWRAGKLTGVASFEDPLNFNDTTALYEFYANDNGQDSMLKVYTDDGTGNRQLDLAMGVEYLPNGKVDKMLLFVDPLGSGSLIQASDYIFHYNTNDRLDSVSFTNLLGGGFFGKLYHKYDANGRLIEFDVWEDDNDGNGNLVLTERYWFKHNVDGLINEVIESEYDSINSSFDIIGSWKYLERMNTNISTPEQQKAKITIYPNPATTEIRIKADQKFDSYEVVSLIGKVVLEGKLSGSISVKDLDNGIYLLHLNKGDYTEVRKFQKN